MTKENLCVFYASNYHLALVLMEYLRKKKGENTKILTFMQDNIEKEIKMIKENYKERFQKTAKINFKKNPSNYLRANFTNNSLNNLKTFNSKRGKENLIIITSGSLNYIEKINKEIQSKINTIEIINKKENNINKERNIANSKITIINCYNFEEQKKYMPKILKQNDKILYTSGERELEK